MSVSLPEITRPKIGPANNLTLRTNLFIDHYLKTQNGTESARVAGHKGDDNTLAVTACRLLRNNRIVDEINRRLGKSILSADEVLEGLSKHARGSIADVLNDEGKFDLKAAKRAGTDKLLKKLKVRTRTIHSQHGDDETIVEHEYEIHDPQAALVHLGKCHQLFTERTESVNVNVDIGIGELAIILRQAIETGLDLAIDVTPEPVSSPAQLNT